MNFEVFRKITFLRIFYENYVNIDSLWNILEKLLFARFHRDISQQLSMYSRNNSDGFQRFCKFFCEMKGTYIINSLKEMIRIYKFSYKNI